MKATADSKRALALRTLEFIEATDRYYDDLAVLTYYEKLTQSEPSLHAHYAELDNSRDEINCCIRAIGGLSVNLDLPNGSSRRVLLGEWHGQDPTNPEYHRWRPYESAPPGFFISIESGAIKEMQEELAGLPD